MRLDQIVGTDSRIGDFDRDFLPRRADGDRGRGPERLASDQKAPRARVRRLVGIT